MITDRARTRRNLLAGSGVTIDAVLPGPNPLGGGAEFFARLAKSRACRRRKWNTTLSPESPDLADPARCGRRRGRQHGGVRLLAAGLPPPGAALRVDGGVVRPTA